MSYGHQYLNYTEDAKEITNRSLKIHHTNSHAQKIHSWEFISMKCLPWDWKSLAPFWEIRINMAVMEHRAFHLSKSLKCKSGSWETLRQPPWVLPVFSSTHIHLQSAPPCVPGPPPYPIQPQTWEKKGETGSVGTGATHSKVGSTLGCYLKIQSLKTGSSLHLETYRIQPLVVLVLCLPLETAACSGHNMSPRVVWVKWFENHIIESIMMLV
jgi:hypothetical protein